MSEDVGSHAAGPVRRRIPHTGGSRRRGASRLPRSGVPHAGSRTRSGAAHGHTRPVRWRVRGRRRLRACRRQRPASRAGPRWPARRLADRGLLPLPAAMAAGSRRSAGLARSRRAWFRCSAIRDRRLPPDGDGHGQVRLPTVRHAARNASRRLAAAGAHHHALGSCGSGIASKAWHPVGAIRSGLRGCWRAMKHSLLRRYRQRCSRVEAGAVRWRATGRCRSGSPKARCRRYWGNDPSDCRSPSPSCRPAGAGRP